MLSLRDEPRPVMQMPAPETTFGPSVLSERRPPLGKVYHGALLRNRSFVDADLQGADFEAADLRGCDFRGADLFGARLRHADLRGAAFDMTRIVEIWLPAALDLEIVNQIRNFDFRHVMTRWIAPNRRSEPLPCPYRTASLRPFFYEWGSRTWNGGAEWSPPRFHWTCEEIVAAVLSELACAHDFAMPWRESRTRLRAAYA